MRSIKITVRLNDEEHEKLKTSAALYGRKMEPYIRSLIMGEKLKPRPPDEWGDLVHQVAKLGNNVNQIARIANANQYISQESIDDLQKVFAEIWKKVRSL